MKRAACVLFAIVALPVVLNVLGDPAHARWDGVGYGGYGHAGYGGYGRYGGAYGVGGVGYRGVGYPGMYGGYYGGGTAAGNYMQGKSQVIAAKGQYNEQTSKAMMNVEDARSKYIDNEKKWTDTYFAMQEENQAHQAEKIQRDKHSQETLNRAARAGLPKPLSSEALDPVSGKITWPDLLQNSAYAAPRKELDRLFQLRATTSANGTAMRIEQATSQMIEILKSNIHNLPTGDYMAARKFLDSLAASASS
ncbi:MAG: hypothetical protein ACT4QC_07425 [Planctomycetaceae bacterium]